MRNNIILVKASWYVFETFQKNTKLTVGCVRLPTMQRPDDCRTDSLFSTLVGSEDSMWMLVDMEGGVIFCAGSKYSGHRCGLWEKACF